MIAREMADLRAVLDRARRGFKLARIPWRDATSWRLTDGFFVHESGGFFSVVGVEFQDEADEAGLYLYQPQSALTGLLTTRLDGELHALLQARVEPGTLGVAQFGPTIQSTPANHQRWHGGRSTPYFEHFANAIAGVTPYGDTVQLDLGERYWMKSKRLIIAQCPPDTAVEPNYTWVPMALLQQGVLCDAFFNIDLRSLLALMPWHGDHLPVRSPAVEGSLQSPPRPAVLGTLAGCSRHPARACLVPLTTLGNRQFTDWGIAERTRRQGFDIECFEVEARGREAARWAQPMVVAEGRGHAVLLCRAAGAGCEVLVTLATESGLQTGAALLPSYLRYPGCEEGRGVAPACWNALPVLAGTTSRTKVGAST